MRTFVCQRRHSLELSPGRVRGHRIGARLGDVDELETATSECDDIDRQSPIAQIVFGPEPEPKPVVTVNIAYSTLIPFG